MSHIQYYSYSQNYSNHNGKENTSTKKIVSNDGNTAKVYETKNGTKSTYFIDNIANKIKLPQLLFFSKKINYLPILENKSIDNKNVVLFSDNRFHVVIHYLFTE